MLGGVSVGSFPTGKHMKTKKKKNRVWAIQYAAVCADHAPPGSLLHGARSVRGIGPRALD